MQICSDGFTETEVLKKKINKCFEMFLSLARRFDVTESVLCTIVMQLLTGTLGPTFWNYTVKP